MHYRKYCPYCEPPKVQIIRTLDLIEAFAHIQVKYYPADEKIVHRSKAHDNVWGYLCDCNYINNDSTTPINFPDILDDEVNTPDEYKKFSSDGLMFIRHLIQAFDLDSLHMKDIQWVVSW